MKDLEYAGEHDKNSSTFQPPLLDIVVLADGIHHTFDPLTRHTCHSLLPVAGKPILEHVLESLSSVPNRKVHVVGSTFIDEIEKFTGKGERWGLDVDVWVSCGNSSALQIVSRYKHLLEFDCLVVDCRYIRDFDLSSVVDQLRNSGEGRVVATRDRHPIGLFWQTHDEDSGSQLPRFLEVCVGECHVVASLQGYLNANLTIAGPQKPTTLSFRGRGRARGLITEAGTRIPRRCVTAGSVLAGKDTIAHKSVEFRGTVVLGSNVVIDSGSTLRSSMVLDDSYIGKNLNIENAIISKDLIISMDSKTHIQLTDRFILSEFRSGIAASYGLEALNRGLGLTALVLSVPLWFIAFLLAFIEHTGHPIAQRRVLGNTFVAGRIVHTPCYFFQFRCRYKLLRHLPLLLQIARGKIRWFGVSILSPEALTGRSAAWEFERERSPVGLLGPAQIQYGIGLGEQGEVRPGNDINAWLMADALYASCSLPRLLRDYFRRSIRVQRALAMLRNLRLHRPQINA